MQLLDIQEKSKSSRNEVIYPKYPMTRIPPHTNQFAHRQHYGGWNWRNHSSQHPDTITGTRYKVYSSRIFISFLSSPVLFSSAADPISEKPTISNTINNFATGCSNFLSSQRTHNNNTVLQPHQT
ncbi:hypothetical protein TNCV_4676591 [Trichonephila clavipes]|nr:hypothetical protein TNCV_4676591 [Trichonephila clavipes]